MERKGLVEKSRAKLLSASPARPPATPFPPPSARLWHVQDSKFTPRRAKCRPQIQGSTHTLGGGARRCPLPNLSLTPDVAHTFAITIPCPPPTTSPTPARQDSRKQMAAAASRSATRRAWASERESGDVRESSRARARQTAWSRGGRTGGGAMPLSLARSLSLTLSLSLSLSLSPSLSLSQAQGEMRA